MVEFDRYKPEGQQLSWVDTIEIAPGKVDRFFLNEDITILLAGNVVNSAGQIQFLSGIDHVLDFSLCHRDPSSGNIVKIKDLDPKDPPPFSGDDIVRLRYAYDDNIEEARFVHKSLDRTSSPKICTTPRMRRMMTQGLNK